MQAKQWKWPPKAIDCLAHQLRETPLFVDRWDTELHYARWVARERATGYEWCGNDKLSMSQKGVVFGMQGTPRPRPIAVVGMVNNTAQLHGTANEPAMAGINANARQHR